MRSIAASVSNQNTAGQLEQRAKLTAVIEFLKPLTAFLRIGFKSQAVKMSGFNAATKYTLANAITGAFPAFEIDYSKAMVSQGTLPEASNPEINFISAGVIEFNWENNSMDYDAMADDKVLLVVYNPEKQEAVTVIVGNTRLSGIQTLTLPSTFKGDEVHCYFGFQNARESIVSNIKYVGSLVVTVI